MVRSRAEIPVYGISTVSFFIILKDGSIKNIMLKECLYIPGSVKSLFSWLNLQSLNQHDRENRGDM
jgi:hypothetical protein